MRLPMLQPQPRAGQAQRRELFRAPGPAACWADCSPATPPARPRAVMTRSPRRQLPEDRRQRSCPPPWPSSWLPRPPSRQTR
eukprot:1625660-Pyramimonas_sp.AAC.1